VARRRRSATFAMDIAPVNLIDLVLILLIFFITTTTFLNLKLIELTLPTAAAGEVDGEKPSMVISIDEGGALYVDKVPVALEALGKTVHERLERRSDVKVLVAADALSRHERFVDVLSVLKNERVANIGIVTDAPEASPFR